MAIVIISVVGEMKGATKRCCYGTCKSDSRRINNEGNDSAPKFFRFIKPCIAYRHKLIGENKRKHINNCAQCKKCKLWVKSCRRADGFRSIDNVTKDTYICSLHFFDKNGPTEAHPNPVDQRELNSKRQIAKKRSSLVEKYNRKFTGFQDLPSPNKEAAETMILLSLGSTKSSENCDETVSQVDQISQIDDEELESRSLFLNNMEESVIMDYTVLSQASTCRDIGIQADGNILLTTCDAGTQIPPNITNQIQVGCNISSNMNTVSCSETQTEEVKTRKKKIQVKISHCAPMIEFINSLKFNEKKCLFYTGLRFSQIIALYNFLNPACENLRFCCSPTRTQMKPKNFKLVPMQQLVLVLVRLRTGLLVEDLSYRFDVSVGSISNIVMTWIKFMYNKFSKHLRPDNSVIDDRGSTHDVVEGARAVSNILPSSNKEARLFEQEEIETELIAKQCISIDHAVGRMKQFRLLQKVLPVSMRSIINQLEFVCSCLANFQGPGVCD